METKSQTHRAGPETREQPAILDLRYQAHMDAYAYDEPSFWAKIKTVARRAGRELISQALRLHYVAADERTPLWAKTAIYGGLAYFILPIDVVPDVLPLVGFGDDIAVLTAVFKAVTDFYRPEHGAAAERKLGEWFK